jgi:hypothetical protein
MLLPVVGFGTTGGSIVGNPAPIPEPEVEGGVDWETGGIVNVPLDPDPTLVDGLIGIEGSVGDICFGGTTGALGPGTVCAGPGNTIGPVFGAIEGGGVVIAGEA